MWNSDKLERGSLLLCLHYGNNISLFLVIEEKADVPIDEAPDGVIFTKAHVVARVELLASLR